MTMNYEKCNHETDNIAREVLKLIANVTGISYAVISKQFRGGDHVITYTFWGMINDEHPDRFNRVDYCPGCKKFTLFLEEDDTRPQLR